MNMFKKEDAAKAAEILSLDFSKEDFTLEDLAKGMNVELEHGSKSPETNVTNDDLATTAKIALAHLREFPDYYQRLEKMEKEAESKN